MPDFQQYLDPNTLAKLKGLRLRARLLVEGFLSGMHRSPYRGFSIEFAEHREYAPGDDLRYVDWKVFGRTDKYYLKQFEEETNQFCYLLVDASESMAYQSRAAALSKLEYAKCAAAALAHLALAQQDAVGLATFDQQVRSFVRPSASPANLEQILGVLEPLPAAEKTSIGPIFHEMAERFRKRGIVLVFSDLFDDPAGMLVGLRHFRHRRHDVIVFHVLDPAELEFGFERLTLFRGLEQLGDVLVDPKAVRKAYLRELERFIHRVKEGCRMQRIDYVQLRTDRPLAPALAGYLAARGARVLG